MCPLHNLYIKRINLARANFDHSTVPLDCGKWNHKSSYFKFENRWLEVDGLKGLIHGAEQTMWI